MPAADEPDQPNPTANPDALLRLVNTVRQLRAPGGCPWDREQTLQSLKPFLIEETYELLDAITSESVEHHKEELGDLLLQILLQTQIRAEQQAFTIDDVANGLTAKLVRRHPHVFGETRVRDSQEVVRNWDAIKGQEKKESPRKSILDGVPVSMPALPRAQKLQRRAAKVGFDWAQVREVLAKIQEELEETREAVQSGSAHRIREEIGDLLFATVNLARFLDIDAEDALENTNRKFIRRFSEIEQRVAASGRKLADCSLEDLDAIWNDVKTAEKQP